MAGKNKGALVAKNKKDGTREMEREIKCYKVLWRLRNVSGKHQDCDKRGVEGWGAVGQRKAWGSHRGTQVTI